MKNYQKRDNGDQVTPTPLRLTLAAAAIATLFIAVSASAEPLFQNSLMPKPDLSRWTDNYVEIGAGGVSTDAASNKSFKFGEYTGLQDEDAFAIVGFNWIFNSRANDALYLRTNAANLGLETRKFSLEGGKQGSWGLSFSADRLLRSEIDDARFVHNGLGTSNLTNPAAGVVGSAATAPLYLKGFDIEQGRDIYRLGLRGILGANWDYKISYREDNRDGTRLTGLPFGTGTIQAAIVPYEINDKTQQVEAALGYLTKAIEGQLAYSYSRYENSLDRFRVENVNGNTNPVAQMSVMPDNEYHQLNLTGAYNFSRNTRAKALLSYGIATQNEAFLPYNSAGAGITSGTLLPARSLDGKMINTLADLALMTKPLEEMDLKFAYQYRDVDNRTPRNTYLYYSRDTTTAPNAATPAGNQRTTAPVSTTEQRLSVDGDYQIAARTQLRGLLEHTITDYTLTDRTQTKTNKAAIDLRRTFSDEFLGNLGYAFTQRTGSAYDKNTHFRESYTGVFALTTNPLTGVTTSAVQNGTLTNHPSMRSFMYNDFDESRIRTSGSWTASETLTAGASVDGYNRDYKGDNCGTPLDPKAVALLGTATLPDTCLGTQKALGGNANIDLQWQPDENLMAFTFYTLAQTKTEIDGRVWSKGNSAAPTPTLNNSLANWYGTMTYTDQTFGLGAKWQVTPKWELGGQYAYSDGVGKTSIKSNTAGAATPLPELESTLDNVNLYAKWVYSSKLTFRFNYLYEHLVSKDWAYDGLTPTTNPGLLMTGQTSANYENHMVAVSVALATW